MRAERRREIERQMMEENYSKAAKKGNGLFVLISLIYIVAAAAFFFFIFKLDVLPAKYLLLGIAIVAVITLFTLPVMISRKGKWGRKIGAAVLSLIMIAGFMMGTYYLASTSSFFDAITRKSGATEKFYLMERKADVPEGFGDMSNSEKKKYAMEKILGTAVGTFTSNDQMYSKAKAILQEEASVDYAYFDSPTTLVQALISGQTNSILIPKASFEALKSEGTIDLSGQVKRIYTLKVPKETVNTARNVNVTKESFNIYISGTDNDGARSDVNMVATVNPVKHEVLLTSIPRDLYVELPSKGAKDKLTHSSIYGMEEAVAAVEKELGIDMNYYVRVNYRALRKVVDAIGGIDVESQYDFYTSGMGRLDGTHFVVGMNHMNGDQALAFCRERHSFMSGDMTRNENQQAVLEAILKKATSSTEILKSYTSILEAVSGNLETSMSSDEMSDLIKMQLNKMPDWKIKKNAIKGETGSDFCYSLGQYASVVYSQPDEITKAVDEIVKTAMNE